MKIKHTVETICKMRQNSATEGLCICVIFGIHVMRLINNFQFSFHTKTIKCCRYVNLMSTQVLFNSNTRGFKNQFSSINRSKLDQTTKLFFCLVNNAKLQ